MRKWAIVSFYTSGTGYENEIKKLIESMREFNLSYYIVAYPPLGTWRRNLNYKSLLIRESLNAFPSLDVVFIDADAIIRKNPVLFDELSESDAFDIAIFRLAKRGIEPNELVASTIWIKNNEVARKIVDRWHSIATRTPLIRHQKCLDIAIKELIGESVPIRVYNLPFEYACIYDHPTRDGREATIEQFQASRRLRREVGFGPPLRHVIDHE